MAMWQTRAVKKKQKTKEMLEMAKVYKKSSSLHEFLVDIDLMQFTYVSTRMFTNPFVIYSVFGQRRINRTMNIAFPALICAIGIGSWLMSSIIMKLIFVSIQFSLIFMEIWIDLRLTNAMRALAKVEIEEMFKTEH